MEGPRWALQVSEAPAIWLQDHPWTWHTVSVTAVSKTLPGAPDTAATFSQLEGGERGHIVLPGLHPKGGHVTAAALLIARTAPLTSPAVSENWEMYSLFEVAENRKTGVIGLGEKGEQPLETIGWLSRVHSSDDTRSFRGPRSDTCQAVQVPFTCLGYVESGPHTCFLFV